MLPTTRQIKIEIKKLGLKFVYATQKLKSPEPHSSHIVWVLTSGAQSR